jgi:replicative DNA helicase
LVDILDKIPPQSLEAEQAMLGAFLIEREAITAAKSAGLDPSHLYRESHRIICDAIYELFDKHEPVDLITLGNLLRTREKLEEIGGLLSLTTMMTNCPTASGVTHYVGIIKIKAYQRSLIKAADEIQYAAYTSESNPDDLQKLAEDTIINASKILTTQQQLPSWFEVAEDAVRNKVLSMQTNAVRGMKTRWIDLDTILVPMREKQSLLIAARPGQGKTMLLLNLCRRYAEDGNPGVIFSKEMDKEQLIERDILGQSGEWIAHYNDVEYLKTYEVEVVKALVDTVNTMHGLPVTICDDNITLRSIEGHIRAELHRLKQLGKPRLKWFALDYLQLMESEGKTKGEYQDTSEVSKGLTNIMNKYRLTMILCSQLSRECEKRDIKRPVLSDLRSSGQIEQDASTVIMLYRPAYYGGQECLRVFDPARLRDMKDASPEEWANVKAQYEQITEFSIAKQRHGQSGTSTYLKFVGQHYRFDDMTPADWQLLCH